MPEGPRQVARIDGGRAEPKVAIDLLCIECSGESEYPENRRAQCAYQSSLLL